MERVGREACGLSSRMAASGAEALPETRNQKSEIRKKPEILKSE